MQQNSLILPIKLPSRFPASWKVSNPTRREYEIATRMQLRACTTLRENNPADSLFSTFDHRRKMIIDRDTITRQLESRTRKTHRGTVERKKEKKKREEKEETV